MKKKKIFFALMLFAGLILSACQPVDIPEEPIITPSSEDAYIYGQEANVESLEVVLLESFPLQAMAVVSGTLPDGCTELYEITVEQRGQEFILTLTTRHPTGDIACTEALVPFEETVSLDILGLDAGTYAVVAQDQQASFTLDVDNVPQQSEDVKYSYGSSATVETMGVQIMESFPVQVSVILTGYLPDGCTEIYEIDPRREGDVFTIEIVTRKPVDVACTMALVPFEETISLEVEGLPAGDYTIVHGELIETFTLDVDNG